MRRRKLISSIAVFMAAFVMAVAVACAVPGAARCETVLRVIAHSDPKVLDPVWTTAYIARNHGYMIYDVLFATDAEGEIRPQMVERYETSPDGFTWTFILREGLQWHDGRPVTAEDCVASLRRWGARDPMGQLLLAATGEIAALGPSSFRIVLREPFALMLESLGKPSSNVPFMMPKRVAETDPFNQIGDYTGSGPFIFKKDEWKPGEKVVYVRNPHYKPRAEPPSMLAGAKVAKVDRVEWIAISDPLMAANALERGEVDLVELPSFDLYPMLRADRNIALVALHPKGNESYMRLNHLHPPFNDLRARRAAMYAIAQEDFLHAQFGDPAIYRTCNTPLTCGSRYEKTYGDLMIKPDLDKARKLLKESGYDGRPVIMLRQADLLPSNQFPLVGKPALERVGFKVEVQSLDWQTVVTRRVRKEPPEKGGWNVFFAGPVTVDLDNPAGNFLLNSSCENALYGWPCDAEMEKLRMAFAREADPERRKAIAFAVSDRFIDQVTYIVLGQHVPLTAYRKDRIDGVLQSPAAVFWNISKKQ